MKILATIAGAIALVCMLAPPAAAQSPSVGKPITLPNIATGTVIYCDDGTGKVALCSFAGGGGGGGTGDASATNQATQIAAEQAIRDRIGAVTSPATGSTNYILTSLQTILSGTLIVGTHAVTQSGTWTAQLGASGLGGSSGNPLYVSTPSSGTTGATGSTAPTNAQLVGGAGPSGNLRSFATDTGGRLLPGQGIVASTRTTLAASTATALEAAGVSARVGASVTVETALTAAVYLCTTQATGCSATAYDFLIPSGSSAGTVYTMLFAPSSRLYAFSTGTPVLVLNSWTAQ